jgi:hypothetical protein
MQNLRKIDLETVVPPIARTVRLRYKFDSKFGGVLLHRTPSDPSPIELSPPSGEIELQLIEPQSIYVQELDGSDGFTISAIGYGF